MDFDSPDVMKDFPGLYSTESGKKNNDSEYSDDSNDKVAKKELLIGKRKDKKDNKKDRGYAALEGESSPEEDVETKSPSKTKKTKSFKFSSKNKDKDKREKDKKVEKEKDAEKKKEKDIRKTERNKEKVKCEKKERKVKHMDDKHNMEELLPVFGVCLEEAVARSRCHDGVELPLPARLCIDQLQKHAATAENLYKVNGIKSKVTHIRKLYNRRELVHLDEYDLATVACVLKTFLRELPEGLLGQTITQFEEAAAVQFVGNSAREAHLLALVQKLSAPRRTLLAWTILHLDYVTQHVSQTKMNAQALAVTLSPVLQMSHRLLLALLCHCRELFPNIELQIYSPPLSMGDVEQLGEESFVIEGELRKQESLLAQLHYEMSCGCVSKSREELLWEVQRIITHLKRKLRSIKKCNDTSKSITKDEQSEGAKMTKSQSYSDDDTFQLKNYKSVKHTDEVSEPAASSSGQSEPPSAQADNTSESDTDYVPSNDKKTSDSDNQDSLDQKLCSIENISPNVLQTTIQNQQNQNGNIVNLQPNASASVVEVGINQISDSTLFQLQHQNQLLSELRDSLAAQISTERSQISYLQYCLSTQSQSYPTDNQNALSSDMEKLNEVMDLLMKENRILKIKKIDLVREIMENREANLALKTKISMSSAVR